MAPCPDNGWQCATKLLAIFSQGLKFSFTRYIDPAGNIQGPFPIEKMRLGKG